MDNITNLSLISPTDIPYSASPSPPVFPAKDRIALNIKWKNAEALQTLYKHHNNLETVETTPRINEILVRFWRFAGNLMTALQLANCSMFLPRRVIYCVLYWCIWFILVRCYALVFVLYLELGRELWASPSPVGSFGGGTCFSASLVSPPLVGEVYNSTCNSFRHIFRSCWHESIKTLPCFCQLLPMSYLIDQRWFLFWQKIIISDNAVLFTLSINWHRTSLWQLDVVMVLHYSVISPHIIRLKIWDSFASSLMLAHYNHSADW